jgi:hypothetical protein
MLVLNPMELSGKTALAYADVNSMPLGPDELR